MDGKKETQTQLKAFHTTRNVRHHLSLLVLFPGIITARRRGLAGELCPPSAAVSAPLLAGGGRLRTAGLLTAGGGAVPSQRRCLCPSPSGRRPSADSGAPDSRRRPARGSLPARTPAAGGSRDTRSGRARPGPAVADPPHATWPPGQRRTGRSSPACGAASARSAASPGPAAPSGS